jgi:hypothetical protein
MRKLLMFNAWTGYGQWAASDAAPHTWIQVPCWNERHLDVQRNTFRSLGIPTAIEYTGDERKRRLQEITIRRRIGLMDEASRGTLPEMFRAVIAADPTAQIEEDQARHAVVIRCDPSLEIPVRYAAWCHLRLGVLLEINPKPEPEPPARTAMNPQGVKDSALMAWLIEVLKKTGFYR